MGKKIDEKELAFVMGLSEDEYNKFMDKASRFVLDVFEGKITREHLEFMDNSFKTKSYWRRLYNKIKLNIRCFYYQNFIKKKKYENNNYENKKNTH